MRTKIEELQYINQLQNQYVDELISQIDCKENGVFKEINLTSPTGTGKTEMMAKMINKKPDWFFLITTLSHGQLHKQVEAAIKHRCPGDNYKVFGVSSFTKASILKAEDILGLLPSDKKVVWLRDEGHRNTNNWSDLLEKVCYKIVNISATNKSDHGVVCNFTDTMMLRTVKQQEGGFQDALGAFLEIKKAHSKVKAYTPCILFRVVSKQVAEDIMKMCTEQKIRYISLVNYDDYDMSELCKDDCDIEAIIYMQKMDVGIDIRRAHVIWIQTKPQNAVTTIQCVGRCRRNALFWREDVDIMNPKNRKLLEATRVCHAFYKIEGTRVDVNEFGELVNAFCPYISVQKLRPNSTIYVENGMLSNGLIVAELQECTGEYTVSLDKKTGFNVVNNSEFYKTQKTLFENQLLDQRLAPFFNPSRGLRGVIKKLVKYIQDNPFLFNQYSIEIIDTPSSGKVTVGLVKRELCYMLAEDDKRYFIKECVHRRYSFRNTGAFAFDISQNCLFYDSVYLERGMGANNYQVYAVEAQRYAALTGILGLARACLNSIYESKDAFPMTMTETKYWQKARRYPYSRKIVLQRNKDIELSSVVLYYNGYFYTYEECLRIAQQGSILPDKELKYQMIVNNKELAVLGPDLYQNIAGNWYPVRSVTSLLTSNTKFRKFLFQHFEDIIERAKPYFYNGKNEFEFDDKKQNSCLGYCVEYYAKSLIYKDYIRVERQGISNKHENDVITIRACLEKYKKMMVSVFGQGVNRTLRLPSADTLGKKEWEGFVKICLELGEKAKGRLCEFLNITDMINLELDTALPAIHLCGLMDVVSKDTIIDIKVTSCISEKMLLQVLAYYYLSTYRSDLDIDRVIVYDAACDRYLAVSGLRTGDIEIETNYS